MIWKVSSGYDYGDGESGPMVGEDVVWVDAPTKEAAEKFVENLWKADPGIETEYYEDYVEDPFSQPCFLGCVAEPSSVEEFEANISSPDDEIFKAEYQAAYGEPYVGPQILQASTKIRAADEFPEELSLAAQEIVDQAMDLAAEAQDAINEFEKCFRMNKELANELNAVDFTLSAEEVDALEHAKDILETFVRGER